MELKEVQKILNKHNELEKEFNDITEFIKYCDDCIDFKISYKNYGLRELKVDGYMKMRILKALGEQLVNILDEQKRIRDTFKDIKVVED